MWSDPPHHLQTTKTRLSISHRLRRDEWGWTIAVSVAVSSISKVALFIKKRESSAVVKVGATRAGWRRVDVVDEADEASEAASVSSSWFNPAKKNYTMMLHLPSLMIFAGINEGLLVSSNVTSSCISTRVWEFDPTATTNPRNLKTVKTSLFMFFSFSYGAIYVVCDVCACSFSSVASSTHYPLGILPRGS